LAGCKEATAVILRVSDIKQYMYCPRVVYFTYVMPVEKKLTYKMEEGKLQHLRLEELEMRRRLKRYRLEQGERRFRTYLRSERLGLEGILDLHIVTPAGCYPVEFKHTLQRSALNHKYQLTAYAMLLEEHYRRPVRYGFLYLMPREEIRDLEITPVMRSFTRRLCEKIRDIVRREYFPPPPGNRGRCVDCEYRNFCADL
jgi:CRISPR-associated exonuclease Cas4